MVVVVVVAVVAVVAVVVVVVAAAAAAAVLVRVVTQPLAGRERHRAVARGARGTQGPARLHTLSHTVTLMYIYIYSYDTCTHGSFSIRRRRGHPGAVLPLVVSNSAKSLGRNAIRIEPD